MRSFPTLNAHLVIFTKKSNYLHGRLNEGITFNERAKTFFILYFFVL